MSGLNTIEVVCGETCGTIAFLGVALGYPLLWLHYASTGVLKLARPPQSRVTAPESTAVAAADTETPAATAGPSPLRSEEPAAA